MAITIEKVFKYKMNRCSFLGLLGKVLLLSIVTSQWSQDKYNYSCLVCMYFTSGLTRHDTSLVVLWCNFNNVNTAVSVLFFYRNLWQGSLCRRSSRRLTCRRCFKTGSAQFRQEMEVESFMQKIAFKFFYLLHFLVKEVLLEELSSNTIKMGRNPDAVFLVVSDPSMKELWAT